MTTGVLIMAYGTPSQPSEIEPYYTRIRHGHAPTEAQLNDLVMRYEAIGGVSPLNVRTAAQVSGITDALENLAPGRFRVAFGSKYQPPLLEDAAESLRDAGCGTIIGLVLAPHGASRSTGEYFGRARAVLGDSVDFRTIETWWGEPEFVALLAERVRSALSHVPAERLATTQVLFSAHSLPARIVEMGDTYPQQLADSAELVATAAQLDSYDMCWQSAGRTPEPWLGPDILDTLRAKAAAGFTDIVSCPIGFVSDHLEVLYDIDIEAQRVAEDVGLSLVRTTSLNDDPVLMAMLARLVVDAAR